MQAQPADRGRPYFDESLRLAAKCWRAATRDFFKKFGGRRSGSIARTAHYLLGCGSLGSDAATRAGFSRPSVEPQSPGRALLDGMRSGTWSGVQVLPV
jgi:hypothetical protein